MIKITIRGQLYKDEDSASYTFPQSEDKTWQTCIPIDPRINLQKLGCKQCYSLWQNKNGIYYAYYRQLPTRAGADAAMIVALCNNVIGDGNAFTSQLKGILEYCIEKSQSRQIDNSIIAEKVNELEKCLTPYPISSNEVSKNNEELLPEGFRYFRNETELGEIIQNPIQLAYRSIKSLFVIEEGSNVPFNDSLREIKDKVRQNYSVIKNVGAIADKTIVLDGDTFGVTYRKQGYNDVKLTLRTDQKSKYFTLYNRRIQLLSAEEVGVEFKKTYCLYAKNRDTQKLIKGWEIICNGHIIPSSGECLNVELPDGKFKFTVKAKGYKEQEFPFNTNEPTKNTFPLEPKEWSSGSILLVTPHTPKGKYVTAEITAIGSNSIASYVDNSINNGNRKFHLNAEYIKKTPRWIFPVLFIAGIIFGIIVGHFVWKAQQTKTPSPTEVTDTHKIDTTRVTEKENEYTTVEDIDIAYLDRETIWELDKIKSDKYKSFLTKELLENSSHIEEHPEITNPSWKELWILKENNSENFRKLKSKFCDKDKGSIDLKKGIEILKDDSPSKKNEQRVDMDNTNK